MVYIDTDGDGVYDHEDAFPNDDSENADSDGDGIGDNADICEGGDDSIDEDGNGTPDACDVALFYLADNGTTVMCPDANVGDTGEVNGVTYTKRSLSELQSLISLLEENAPYYNSVALSYSESI